MRLLIFILWFFIVLSGIQATEYSIAESFQFPVDNYITKKGSNHFNAYDIVYSYPIKHLGDDVGVSAGTKVFSPANGIIRRAYNSSSYGGVYLIECTTAYEREFRFEVQLLSCKIKVYEKYKKKI